MSGTPATPSQSLGDFARETVQAAIRDERDRQDAKWGGQPGVDRFHSQTLMLAILGEEFGEVARAILEDDYAGLVDELIHVAAVASAFAEEAALRRMER